MPVEMILVEILRALAMQAAQAMYETAGSPVAKVAVEKFLKPMARLASVPFL